MYLQSYGSTLLSVILVVSYGIMPLTSIMNASVLFKVYITIISMVLYIIIY